MNRDEAHGLLNYIRQTANDFYIVPETASKSWAKALEQYTRNECMDAVDYIVANSDRSPTVSSIRAQIERIRYNRRTERENAYRSNLERVADKSFAGVPGETPYEQRIYVCADQAAKHWRGGEHDNDFFNARLLDAKKCGFKFEGVDYSKVKVSKNYDDNWFSRLARVGG